MKQQTWIIDFGCTPPTTVALCQVQRMANTISGWPNAFMHWASLSTHKDFLAMIIYMRYYAKAIVNIVVLLIYGEKSS